MGKILYLIILATLIILTTKYSKRVKKITTEKVTNSKKLTMKKVTNSNNFKKTKTELIKKLAEGMKLTHDIFTKNKINYIISYGSLLGAIRHNKIIPWDDDADLIIYRQDIDKILNLKDEFNKHGWTVEMNWKLLKIKQLDKDGQVLEESFIDLFIIDTKKENNKIIVPRCLTKNYKYRCEELPKNNNWWHSWFNFEHDLINKKKLYHFYDMEIGYDFKMYGPVNGEKILKFWYGKDCLKLCQSPVYDHNTGKYIKSSKIKCSELKNKFNI